MIKDNKTNQHGRMPFLSSYYDKEFENLEDRVIRNYEARAQSARDKANDRKSGVKKIKWFGLFPAIFLMPVMLSSSDVLVQDETLPQVLPGYTCPSYVYGINGVGGTAVYNLPASGLDEIHPPFDQKGLPSGEAINGNICTYHVQCTETGWKAIQTQGDQTCRSWIYSVQ